MTTTTPAIRVHSLDDARAACAAAADLGVPVRLVSAPAGAAHGGALWFRELVARAAAEWPSVGLTAVLDCADRAGDAQGALAAGIKAILFTGPAPVAATLTSIAERMGSTVLTEPPAALDLRGARDPVAACRQHLAKGSPGQTSAG
ncbi:hypothetical protein [Azospirillum canadense]|uniref:hypothetical protein n=1 Tax=Azospirillum canadense TaxID=403962 RepID=UPI0022266444|nr:hypothetical protein [Azospirillum canadense]MCW2236520.1 hypothetical protein [Azospirillum canadense]